MIAAFFAGVAGGLYAHEKGNMLSPDAAGFQRSFNYVLMTVLGGRGSITGVMLAATILTILPEALREFDQWRLIIYALLLIGMMLLRPQGLFGIHEIWDWRPKWFSRRQIGSGGRAMSKSANPNIDLDQRKIHIHCTARCRRHRHFVRRARRPSRSFRSACRAAACTASLARTAPAKRLSSIC